MYFIMQKVKSAQSEKRSAQNQYNYKWCLPHLDNQAIHSRLLLKFAQARKSSILGSRRKFSGAPSLASFLYVISVVQDHSYIWCTCIMYWKGWKLYCYIIKNSTHNIYKKGIRNQLILFLTFYKLIGIIWMTINT